MIAVLRIVQGVLIAHPLMAPGITAVQVWWFGGVGYE
jgi:hypothetical protein